MTSARVDPRVDAVVFDLGGVLINWDPRHLYRQMLPDDAAIEEFLETVGFAAWNARQDAGTPFAQGVAELSAEHPEYAGLIAAYPQRFAQSLVGADEGTVAILRELHAGHGVRLFALTNWSAETFGHAERQFDFLELFEAIVVSGRERLAKPDPAIFRLMLARHGLRAECTMFIDDSTTNVDAARRLGLRTLHFTSATALECELGALGLLRRGDPPAAANGAFDR